MVARVGGKRVSKYRGGAAAESPDTGYTFPTSGSASSVGITAVPTINCMSLYWKATNGSTARECLVRYKPSASSEWVQGHSFKFDDRSTSTADMPTTAARQNEYRGSIVGLTAGTEYDFELYVGDHGEKQSITATTWSEVASLPVGVTVTVGAGSSSSTYSITTGGTASAYRVYDFTGHTIDVNKAASYCIDIATTARYIIVKNATLLGATLHGITIRTTTDSAGVDDPLVVITGCDISDWGSQEPTNLPFGRNCDSAIGTPNSSTHFTERVIIDNCYLHDPTYDSNSWVEPSLGTHPEGPQAVTIYRPTQQIVIRYCTIQSDEDHKLNDGFGSPANNFSFTGFPCKDSDIHNNYFRNIWDDSIESEGGNCNVRIWENFSDLSFNHIASASTSLGPLYVWRNIGFRTQDRVSTNYALGTGNKNRRTLSGGTTWGGGWCFWYHNTFYRAGTAALPEGCHSAMVSDDYRNTVAKNNILGNWSRAVANGTNTSNEFDYNVYSGTLQVPPGQMANGINGQATYDAVHASGPYTLTTSSNGYQDGVEIKNFTQTFSGAAPDIGAIERGQTAVRYGYIAP
jgi:hypothetical protein